MNGPTAERYLKEAVADLPKKNETMRTAWRSPSNIALVKYWGKSVGQVPKNPSLSFSLSESLTEMQLEASPHKDQGFRLEYYFEGEKKPEFAGRISKFLESILAYFPFLDGFHIRIESSNTFPHSSGIASSASSMSALALCLCSLEEKMLGRRTREEFFRKASFISRLGSGSAARSVYGGFCSWGKTGPESGLEGSDEYATALGLEEKSKFSDLRDSVLIVSPGKKSVSSSTGHATMDDHPFAGERFREAAENHAALWHAIRENDVRQFIRITEKEALTLHGLMMSADPGFILLQPGSLEIIRAVRDFREQTGTFLTFTIDAGPNIHLIYPEKEKEKVRELITGTLLQYCYEDQWIDDRMGRGPLELST